MRKVLLILLLVVFVTSLPAAKAYLFPSENGGPSEIVPVGSLPRNVDVTPARKDLRGVLFWMMNTDNGTENYVLTGIADVDTFLNWFAPPAACTVLAYEVTNIANYADPNQDEFTMFFATLDQGINYATGFPEYHGGGAPSSNYGFATVVQSLDTFAWGLDTLWTITQDTLLTPIDNGLDKFACGWVKAAAPDSSPNPYIYANGVPPYHALMYRDLGQGQGKGWYSSWHCVRMRALVNFYSNPPPIVAMEDLPDSYNQGARTVNLYVTDFGVPLDSSGVVGNCAIEYQVNGGAVTPLSAVMYSGDSTDGYWSGDIPGVGSGDVVVYWAVTTDLQGAADTTNTATYTIREGTPGNCLFVDNGYTISGMLPDWYADTCDLWDFGGYGQPDSSVLCFYNTVVWRAWGETALGDGGNYGAGIYYSDSTWIKMILDDGGNFWFSDQDQGYGLGICPDYGQQGVPDGHWVREYLGIQGMFDDQPLMGGSDVTAYGNPADPVIGDLFGGIGLQAAGAVYLAPYYALTGNFSYAYTGNFDSLEAGAVINMFDVNGLTISYRYEGPGGSDYKVYDDFYPWDYICDPADASVLDMVTIDSLVEDVLGRWFGYYSGVSDGTLEPGKLVELLPVGVVTNEALIKFSLPLGMVVSLDIYDNTGRLVKNLVNGKVSAGLHTVRWNADVANGVYFYRLKAGDKRASNKMVVIR